jgi:hypothetical protein
MPRLELILLHSASADGYNALRLFSATDPILRQNPDQQVAGQVRGSPSARSSTKLPDEIDHGLSNHKNPFSQHHAMLSAMVIAVLATATLAH